MTTVPLRRLRPRAEPLLAERLARSAEAAEGAHLRTVDVPGWLRERSRAHDFRVTPVPLADLRQWSFDEDTGDLRHASGRFFTVEGLRVRIRDTEGGAAERGWHQPILNQPEIGILGLLVKDIDGVPHVLMQAKMEPGNRNMLELSPTVQATWSNYNRVHRGTPVRYLEHFTAPARGRVLADVLQSEQGSWFYRKVNRNMIVEAAGDVVPHEDFCWLTLGQLGRLLRTETVVSMDARSALSCVPFDHEPRAALHSDGDVLSWFTHMRSRYSVDAERMPLGDVPGWRRAATAGEHRGGRYFRIIGVSVQAGSREVPGWTQPLLEPCGTGVAAFLTCDVERVPHVLAHARPAAGLVNGVEIAPTVACTPDNYAHLPPDRRPAFLRDVLTADPGRIRYDAVQSEEGGRFHRALTRYLLVDVDEPFPPPPDYRWIAHGQLTELVTHSHYLTVEARTLLAALNAHAAAA